MTPPVKPFTFANGPGNLIDATQVNDDFDELYDFLATGVGADETGVGDDGLAKGSFSAYRNAALSVVNAAAVPFDTEEWDVSNWFNVANGRFTPQVAGIYRLTARVRSGVALTADTYFYPFLRKNGAVVKEGQVCFQRGGLSIVAGIVSALVVANGSTDYFDVAVTHGQGGSVALDIAQPNTYFQGELVGKT